MKSIFSRIIKKMKSVVNNDNNEIINLKVSPNNYISDYLNIDEDFYKNHYNDLSGFSDQEAVQHYQNHGYIEGRICSSIAKREDLINIVKGDKILEIGPFDHPLLKGSNIIYADIDDKDGLIAKAKELKSPFNQVPEIDYVISDGSLKSISDKFDAIISAHNIEHHPNLIGHLCEAAELLNEGGKYYLIIPDSKHCFDASLNITEIGEIIEANEMGRKNHSLNSVIKHYAMTSHNNSIEYWRENENNKFYPLDAERIKNAVAMFKNSSGNYIDAHAWQFSPLSFSKIINCLIEMQYIPFKKVIVNGPVYGLHEFTAILYK